MQVSKQKFHDMVESLVEVNKEIQIFIHVTCYNKRRNTDIYMLDVEKKNKT